MCLWGCESLYSLGPVLLVLIIIKIIIIIQDRCWRNIWSPHKPVQVLNEHLKLSLLVRRYAPTKVIRVRNKDKPWLDDQFKRPFGLIQEARLRWTRDRSRVYWDEFDFCQVRANETYLNGKRQLTVRNVKVLVMPSPFKSGGSLLSLLCYA